MKNFFCIISSEAGILKGQPANLQQNLPTMKYLPLHKNNSNLQYENWKHLACNSHCSDPNLKKAGQSHWNKDFDNWTELFFFNASSNQTSCHTTHSRLTRLCWDVIQWFGGKEHCTRGTEGSLGPVLWRFLVDG